MSEAHLSDTHHGEHAAPETEHDVTPNIALFIYLFALTLIIGGFIVGTWAYFEQATNKELALKAGTGGSIALNEMRAREADLLAKGGKADDLKPGANREPIAKAMDRVAADPSLLGAVIVAPPPAPAPPPPEAAPVKPVEATKPAEPANPIHEGAHK